MAICCNGLHGLREIQSEYIHYLIYYEQQSKEHTKCLKCIGQYKGAYSAPPCIEPYQCNQHHNGDGKRNGVFVENELLEYHADNIEANGGTCHL